MRDPVPVNVAHREFEYEYGSLMGIRQEFDKEKKALHRLADKAFDVASSAYGKKMVVGKIKGFNHELQAFVKDL